MRLALVAVVLALSPTLAHADALGPPPASCPEGSAPVACHGPETCEIADCITEGDCRAGERCMQRMLCVREHCCSGVACTIPDSMPLRYTHVAGPCGASGSCGDPSLSCASHRVCVPGTPLPDSGSATDSGTGGTDSGGAWIDSGSTDAGRGSSSGGGCCAVLGVRSAYAPLAITALALLAVAVRRRR